ncbi:MAG: hypothetical protein P8X64_02930 [Anaerolineales bacterium]
METNTIGFQDIRGIEVESEFVFRSAEAGSGGIGRSIGYQQTLMALRSLSIPKAGAWEAISWGNTLRTVGALR